MMNHCSTCDPPMWQALLYGRKSVCRMQPSVLYSSQFLVALAVAVAVVFAFASAFLLSSSEGICCCLCCCFAFFCCHPIGICRPGCLCLCRRNCPGGQSNSRLNARLNAASEPYPTAAATSATLFPVDCRICAPSFSRHCARYAIGDSPRKC